MESIFERMCDKYKYLKENNLILDYKIEAEITKEKSKYRIWFKPIVPAEFINFEYKFDL